MDTPLPLRTLGRDGPPVTRLGLGLAAVGRPAYHNLGHATDLGADRSVDGLRAHAHALLDHAWSAGVRYLDVARSYGCGEDFLGAWLAQRQLTRADVTVGSKWGYIYTADWRPDATTHEVKDHHVANLTAQWDESDARLGPWLATYSIHSATLDTGVLDDQAVLDQLTRLRDERGVRIGLTVTGARQSDTVRRALDVRGGGLFSVVQATLNVLTDEVDTALREAHAAGLGVVVKEALGNGRLTPRSPDRHLLDALAAVAARLGTTVDALALAWVLDHPHVDVVLSGAATTAQLDSHARALSVRLDDDARAALAALTEAPDTYWATRRSLPWT